MMANINTVEKSEYKVALSNPYISKLFFSM